MVHPQFSLVFRAAFGAALLSLAVPAEATLYKWLDQKGNVTYSNIPPGEGVEVRELETIDENRAPTAVELRTRQILEESARERRATGGMDPFHVPGTARALRGAGAAEIDAGVKYEWVPQGSPPAAAPLLDSATLRYPPATPVTVRDPCLLSPDPRCYQSNAANYDPYLGYAPARVEGGASYFGATRNEASGAVGATIATPETVGAAVSAKLGAPASHSQTPTPRGFRGLPPGTPVLPISR
jgi:hypothetical protein